jgi:hypothetical protein
MQKDKKLKKLLMKYAVEEAPENFTGTVMQRIESMAAAKTHTASSTKYNLLKVLFIAFFLVCAALLMLSIFIKGVQLPIYFSLKLPAEYFSQVVFFLISFWIVMLINLFWNKMHYTTNYL